MSLVKRFSALSLVGLLSLGASPAFASDAEVRAFLTYATLMEVHAATKGKLTEQLARQTAAAVGSLGLNRTTVAIGGGICGQSAGPRQNPAIDLHGFVPRALRLLPALYLRDYVRGTLVGLTDAANTQITANSQSNDINGRAIGEVLHLTQDIAINQAGTEPIPFVADDRSPAVARDSDRLLGQDGKLTDGALRGLMQTVVTARALDKTGALPSVAPLEAFSKDYFAPLSSADKSALIKVLRDANVYRYVEAIGSPSDTTIDWNARGSAIWAATHSGNPSAFAAPDISSRGTDLVAFDVHPDWLIPLSAQSSGDAARRVIDDLALAQQTAAQLREEVMRLQTAASAINDQSKAARLKFALDAILKGANDAETQLRQAVGARVTNDRQAALAQAQVILTRTVKDADRLTVDFDLQEKTASNAAPAVACLGGPSRVANGTRVQEIADLIVRAALLRVGSTLPTKDSTPCQSVALEAVSSVFNRKQVIVPTTCRALVIAARDALEEYARSHADTHDQAIERSLAELVSQ